ncbi:phosphopantothenoylcysteine decarboxylase [Actinomyces sp. oral taxon 414]|uniref:bifunctional phosphopantothenoylcysteine decarboxylase/phosphopantothenate synthase n=1 Tax=Actinomyces sp. oral taxon 414 TaxID=712122 RepID=UPI0006AD8CA7|nr:bifunctional phosphopantothenoylcysteine decarboxylase/phosphopantothenate synthase [Actinomyces sp. oral taxon 414]ALC99273.1 phosphopantothenoylcysteine decarboxylase [Actinomyces sp. oral taxon 414]
MSATGAGARRVVVGVAGSVSAYKAPTVIRLLRRAGHEVEVVATAAALRFIGAPALAAVAGGPVSTGLFDDPAAVSHVALGERADLVVVAPATADLLARVAAGRADDLLTATILTTRAPVVLAPAMHTQMWTNPATAENVATLRRRGLTVIDPDIGPLTGGDVGAGRLPEPERIVERALAVLGGARAAATASGADDAEDPAALAPGGGAPLAGLRVVVSAGGTREPIDPVRYLGNRSSGRQGVALAAAAARAGADVVLVAANIGPEVLGLVPGGVEILPVGTALELRDAVRGAARDADAVVMAAAVADFRPARPLDVKLKKPPPGPDGAEPAPPALELVANPDVLAGLAADPPRPAPGRTLLVGFAAETGDETGDVLAHGAAKARRKGADLLAVNAVGPATGFGDVPNSVVVLDAAGAEVARAAGSKDEVARALIALIARRLGR